MQFTIYLMSVLCCKMDETFFFFFKFNDYKNTLNQLFNWSNTTFILSCKSTIFESLSTTLLSSAKSTSKAFWINALGKSLMQTRNNRRSSIYPRGTQWVIFFQSEEMLSECTLHSIDPLWHLTSRLDSIKLRNLPAIP